MGDVLDGTWLWPRTPNGDGRRTRVSLAFTDGWPPAPTGWCVVYVSWLPRCGLLLLVLVIEFSDPRRSRVGLRSPRGFGQPIEAWLFFPIHQNSKQTAVDGDGDVNGSCCLLGRGFATSVAVRPAEGAGCGAVCPRHGHGNGRLLQMGPLGLDRVNHLTSTH